MALLGLASSLCPLTDPEGLLDFWRAARRDHPWLGLVTDPRLDLPAQRAVLQGAHDVSVLQLCLPGQDRRGRAQPCPCSADRAERGAARKLLAAQIALARSFDVPTVIVPWVELELHRSMAELQRLFSRGLQPPLDDLDDERASFGQTIADRLLEWLDPALLQASNENVELQLCTPAIWPHQAPDGAELIHLHRELAGAPLALLHGSDWAHARRALRGDEPESQAGPAPLPVDVAALCAASGVPLSPAELGLPPIDGEEARPQSASKAPPIAASRLADASGLSLRLPPGLGEVDGSSLRQAMAEHPATLWLDPLWQGELTRTLSYLDQGE